MQLAEAEAKLQDTASTCAFSVDETCIENGGRSSKALQHAAPSLEQRPEVRSVAMVSLQAAVGICQDAQAAKAFRFRQPWRCFRTLSRLLVQALRDVRMHAEQQLAWILQRMGVTHQAVILACFPDC